MDPNPNTPAQHVAAGGSFKTSMGDHFDCGDFSGNYEDCLTAAGYGDLQTGAPGYSPWQAPGFDVEFDHRRR